jgi:multicomponent Na+:H+ antiporter subunit F
MAMRLVGLVSIQALIDPLLAILGVALLLSFMRLIRGPTLPDRVVALDLIVMLAVAIITLYAVATNEPILLDTTIALAPRGHAADGLPDSGESRAASAARCVACFRTPPALVRGGLDHVRDRTGGPGLRAAGHRIVNWHAVLAMPEAAEQLRQSVISEVHGGLHHRREDAMGGGEPVPLQARSPEGSENLLYT